MPLAVAQGEDGQDYERCLNDLKDQGAARYGICMKAYEEHHYKNKEGKWVRKKGHTKNDKGEWVVKNFKGFDDWIEIFRGGKQVDSAGKVHDGDELIAKALQTFDPSVHEPPIVIGHPTTNAPAYGWVEGLKAEVVNGVKTLYIKAKQVVPEFKAMVEKGLFKKRSASFYPDGRLRHVGFLGAAPPAVKGLADLKFGDEEDITFEFEEGSYVKDEKFTENIIRGVVEGLKSVFGFAASDADKAAQEARSKKYGIAIKKENSNVTKPSQWANVPDSDWLDPVNYRYPMPDDDHIRNAAARWAQVKPGDYSPTEVAIINKRLDAAEKKAKIGKYKTGGTNMAEKLEFTEEELQAKINEAVEEATKKVAEETRKKVEMEFAEKQAKERAARIKKETEDWIKKQKEDGKIIPAWEKMGIASFIQSLDATKELEFAEGKKSDALTWFKNFIEELPKVVVFKEVAGGEDDFAGKTAAAKLSVLTRKKLNDNPQMDYATAFSEVQVENPELAAAYAAEIGGE